MELPPATGNPRNLYQVDTDPVLFPDLSREYEKTVDAFSLAYIAFNVPHFAGSEQIVCNQVLNLE